MLFSAHSTEFEFIYLSTLHCEMGRKGKSCVVQLEGPLRPYTRQQWAGTEHFQKKYTDTFNVMGHYAHFSERNSYTILTQNVDLTDEGHRSIFSWGLFL